MTYTACTTPAAPFYEADLAILSALEGAGLDLPCQVIAAGLGLTAALAFGMLVLAAVAVVTWRPRKRRCRA